MDPVDRRTFLTTLARGAAWVAPAVVTLSTPAGLEAQATSTTKGGGGGAQDMGQGKGKDGNLIVDPIGPSSGSSAPWSRRPPGGG